MKKPVNQITFNNLLTKYCNVKNTSDATAYNYSVRLRRSGWVNHPVIEVTNETLNNKIAAIDRDAAMRGKSSIWAYQVGKVLRCLVEFAREEGLLDLGPRPVRRPRELKATSVMPIPVKKVNRAALTDGITFGDMFRAYIDHHARLHCVRWRDSERAYRYLQHWDSTIAGNISKFDVQKLHSKLGSENGVTTANRAVQLLRSVYNRALAWEIYEGSNPGVGVKLFRLQSRERFLEVDEVRKFMLALDSLRNDTTRDFILMCLLTAARRNNVAAMRWDEISFALKMWTIPKTKNGMSQRLPLTSWAVRVLEERKRHVHGEFVFPSDRSQSGHITKPEEAWTQIKLRSGLDNVRVHDLRRTLASWEAMTGANLSVIAATLNHKDFKSVQIYARLHIEPIREAMETATEKMFSGMMQELPALIEVH